MNERQNPGMILDDECKTVPSGLPCCETEFCVCEECQRAFADDADDTIASLFANKT